MLNKKSFGLIAIVIATLFVTILLAGCTSSPEGTSPQNTTAATSGNQSLVIATTTSLYAYRPAQLSPAHLRKPDGHQVLITEQGR